MELCKDCLLIVYQFANETKRLTGNSNYKANKLSAPRQLKSREIINSFTTLPRRSVVSLANLLILNVFFYIS